MQKENRQCNKCGNEFELNQDDFSFYEKMKVPAPNVCPDCRMKQKLLWRNEQALYNRTCDLCGESIISIYHPKYSAPVYCIECHTSDKWDPFSFGIEYDKERPFFEQFKELMNRIPKAATHVGTAGSININSEYVNFAGGNKNCYLIFNSTLNEDSRYSRGIIKSQDACDIYFAEQIESCYENINLGRCSRVLWSKNTTDSLNSYFLLNCSGCSNCFGCVNLRHKSYFFLNEPLSKEEWEKQVNEILGSYEKITIFKKEFEKFSLKFPRRENNNLKTMNSSGDYIFESKNCFFCFEAFQCENCKYALSIKLAKDSYDIVGRGVKSELLLETVATGHGCSRIIGTWSLENSHDVEYSYDLRASSYCIGCVGIKHGQYCILNKAYTEEEYKRIKNIIATELCGKEIYGQYFPTELSPWAYNETLAQEYFPLIKDEALAQGFRWEDNIQKTEGKETIKSEEIQDHIKDISDSIINEILPCIDCNRNYKITAQELVFYRKMIIPIPRKCFYCRHKDRIIYRGPYKFWKRNCDKCKKEITTNYAPNRPEIIYCEKCYQQKVI
jgi:hypothetical protein